MTTKKIINGVLIAIGAFGALEVILRVTTGDGIITPSKKKKGEFVMTSAVGRNQPLTVAEYYDASNPNGLLFWMGLGNNYANAYYKAVWATSKGKAKSTFMADGNTYFTKGGKIKA